jgi:hypothetical protein
VSIFADGQAQPQTVVISGQVTLQQAATKVHIGLPIQADFETLEIKELDKKKIINFVSLIVNQSTGIMAGPDPDHLMAVKATNQPNSVTGETEVSIPATWSKSGRIFVRQDNPLPVSILAVIPDVTLGGR